MYMNKVPIFFPIFWHCEFLFSYFFDHSYYLTPWNSKSLWSKKKKKSFDSYPKAATVDCLLLTVKDYHLSFTVFATFGINVEVPM